jgi:hypothetical protein
MYEPMIVPTAEADLPNWEVVDEKTGKKISVPHPVSGLRVWNCEKGEYDQVSAVLGTCSRA